MSKVIVLDWDGTLVESKWPDMGDWMPGAVEACHALHNAGCRMLVFSARLNPLDPFTGEERSPAEMYAELARMRQKLDYAALPFVDIYTGPGKPGGDVYVDDKAERYSGSPRAWKLLVPKILVRLGEEPDFYPSDYLRGAAGALS